MFKRELMLPVVAALILCSCEEKKQIQPFAPIVGVTKVVKQNVPLKIEAPAKITGSLEIQVRAQVGGILKSRTYQEGEYVQQGVKLFEIDPAPYKAALTRAQGTLAQAQSELRRTSRDYARMQKLRKSKAISQKEYDDSLSAYERAQANMKVAEGALHEAEINLGYTEVKAPISGIVRKEAQSVGNLISPNGESSLLTSMVKVCPLHANFSISGATWTNLARSYRSGHIELADRNDIQVEVIMADGTVYPEKGKVIFVDSSEDSMTSSVSIKAEIATTESQKILMPGQFVRVRIIGAEYKDALVIPATALISTQSGFSVYLVKEDKTVEVRPVVAEIIDNKAVVREGIKAGDVVVSEGIVKVRPGQPVSPLFKESK